MIIILDFYWCFWLRGLAISMSSSYLSVCLALGDAKMSVNCHNTFFFGNKRNLFQNYPLEIPFKGPIKHALWKDDKLFESFALWFIAALWLVKRFRIKQQHRLLFLASLWYSTFIADELQYVLPITFPPSLECERERGERGRYIR